MAEIREILNTVRALSPEAATQPDFADNVGLLVGSESGWTERILTCLDVTGSVIEEAHEAGARLILSHHPVIFSPIIRVDDLSHTGRVIMQAIKRDISLYAAHTNLDFCDGGINDYNAKLIGLRGVQPLETLGGVHIGRVGDLFEPITLEELTRQLREKYSDGFARYVGDGGAKVKRVSVVNGGGGKADYIAKSAAIGADCYISADFPHHALLHARECGINLVILQHYCMEHIYINKWTEKLNKLAAVNKVNVEFIQAKSESNPTQTEDL